MSGARTTDQPQFRITILYLGPFMTLIRASLCRLPTVQHLEPHIEPDSTTHAVTRSPKPYDLDAKQVDRPKIKSPKPPRSQVPKHSEHRASEAPKDAVQASGPEVGSVQPALRAWATLRRRH